MSFGRYCDANRHASLGVGNRRLRDQSRYDWLATAIHRKITAVHDVMVVVSSGLENSSSDHDDEYGRMLKINACNPLAGELVELRFTIRQLGGQDLFSDEYEDNDPDEQDEVERNSKNRSFL